MHSGQGSYLEFTVPFVVDVSGYTTKVNGQMMHLDATTSLKFRSLIQCETLEVCIHTCSGKLKLLCMLLMVLIGFLLSTLDSSLC